MAWHEGTATGYQNMLDILVEFATNDNVQSAAVAVAGTSYVVGDVLTASGGTATTQARIEVTSVGGSGDVTGVRVVSCGAYSVQPSNPVTMIGGTGSGCTLNFTFQTAGWTVLRNVQQIYARRVQSIQAGGTGYSVNDIVTLDSSGGTTAAVTEATFRVTAVSSGVATAVSVETPGEYTASAVETLPTTGGGGTGLTLIVDFEGEAGENEVILQSTRTEQTRIGVRTFSPGGGAFNWWLGGFTAFDSELSFENQPGAAPGSPTIGTGNFMLLTDTTANFWMSTTSRRIHLVAQAGTIFNCMSFGLLDRLTTSGQYPYPIYVIGSCDTATGVASSPPLERAGLPDPMGGSGNGPGAVRGADGTWSPIRNWVNGSLTTVLTNVFVFPFGNGNFSQLADADDWPIDTSAADPGFSSTGFFDNNFTDDAIYALEPTPHTGGALSLLFPLTLILYSSPQILGQIDGVFWASSSRDGGSPANAGDFFLDGSGVRYLIVSNSGRTNVWNFGAFAQE